MEQDKIRKTSFPVLKSKNKFSKEVSMQQMLYSVGRRQTIPGQCECLCVPSEQCIWHKIHSS